MASPVSADDRAVRASLYAEFLPAIRALITGEPDVIANLANTTAALKTNFGFLWVGFYLVRGEDLVLGPFQGSAACTRIAFGKGVCGAAWARKSSLVVSDVDEFPGHIACSPLSRSEIVVPLLVNNEVVAVLDIDSDRLNEFTDIDRYWLEELAAELAQLWQSQASGHKN